MNNTGKSTLAAEELQHIRSIFQDSAALKLKVAETLTGVMGEIATVLFESLKNGGKILFCGNGGSAADAQHLAAELLIRLRPKVNRDGIPAIALAGDTSSITACGNDFSYDCYYERLVAALGRQGDVLVGITTSGKSSNVIRALKKARSMGLKTIGFLGCDGGPALPECDVALVVPSSATGRIQEVHIAAGHAILEVVEERLMHSMAVKQLSVGEIS